ncbi:23S rRNA methyltransferase TrmH, group 3 [Renibacterium salmoninarum ATCC 33209]|uniref:23S rRNA methyltransferase TrmH, group 3 n=1 Tax=Renibacterium salmoninarum (strain ATCC 33209 / DSM 20767 / JCM 11484 / NBRC 15589 / NCIMB 2235) TaxID=288705 RepID=A9WLY5_RENSM|nr:23S rRNA (guanosine(2251)-2'-O)-methyltransferase RlmB [Renibacterium salmoninarum]ABY22166.1 23S rRNA methyltransferase TrmH, group 3 [Renibacterium salmoninarum ATCC 33209]
MAGNPRAAKGKKGPSKGTGGLGRKALEGKGPTPKAEDRPYHKAFRSKELSERSAAKRPGSSSPSLQRTQRRGRPSEEMVTGRNSVVEALRAGIPAKALYIAVRIEVDDRVKEVLKLASERGIPLMETHKPELDRMTDDAVHQGLALQIPPYDYPDAIDIAQETVDKFKKGYIKNSPLIVALDGITDPRNLGAIIRSVSAFAGQAVIVPERRSVGLTASAWKTSAGAAVRVPVARAGNLNRALESFKGMGYFVLGLDGDGDVSLPALAVAKEPVCIVVGSEGKGLSRLVRENCDQIVSIPIDSAMESLNASMAVGITLYEIARQRSGGSAEQGNPSV